MSERVDQFTKELRERLTAAESRLVSVKARVEALPGETEQAVRDAHDQLQSKLEADKERVEKTRAGLKSRVEQMRAETRETVREWKAKREVKKLHARADRAASNAYDAVEVAMVCIVEAEAAIVEAVAARMDADAVDASA